MKNMAKGSDAQKKRRREGPIGICLGVVVCKPMTSDYAERP